MSSIDSAIETDGAASERRMPSQAKVCLTVCIGLFAVTAYTMLGLNSLVIAAWNFVVSDWSRTAAIVLTFLAIILFGYGLDLLMRRPTMMLKFAATVALVCIPFSWYGIATYVADDASHPVSLTLISPMVLATTLFAYCGSRHFSTRWGRSAFTRLLTSFIAASAVALFVAVLPVMISYDNDRNVAQAAAEKTFSDLHPGQTNVAASELVSIGRNFKCWIDNSRVRCVQPR